MMHIRSLPDTEALQDNPELYREVAAYLLYCRLEILEYEDEEDIDDFSFMVLEEEDLPMLDDMLNDFGPPEETVQISIKADSMLQTIYRIVYASEVIFIPAEIADHISEKFSF